MNDMRLLGWTLIHSVWEIGLIGLGLFVLLRLLSRASAHTRYWIALVALAASLTLTGVTFGVLQSRESPTIASIATSLSASGVTASSASVTKIASTPFVSAAVASEPTPSPVERFLPNLVLLWLAGVALMSARIAGGLVALQRLKASAVPDIDGRCTDGLEALRARIGVLRPLEIRLTSAIESPIMVGLFKSVILFPTSAVTRLSPQQLESLLAHELAHVQRWDFMVNLIQSVLETVLFYHPAIWWMSKVVRTEREHCCDDIAIRLMGDKASYARTLLLLEEIRSESPRLAMAANSGSLLTRIRRLYSAPARPSSNVAWVTCAVTLLLMGTLARTIHAQREQKLETFSVQVLKPDGQPADRAEVYVQLNNGHIPERLPITGITNAQGLFSYPVRPGRRSVIFSHLKGFAPACFISTERTRTTTLRLAKANQFTVKLVDLQGHPLSNIRVAPSYFRILNARMPIPDQFAQGFAATTNALGRAEVQDLPEPGPPFGILDDRYAVRGPVRQVPDKNGVTTLEIEPAGSIQGRIGDEGNTIPGANIWVTSSNSTGYRDVWADDQGRFEVKGLPQGEAHLQVFLSSEQKKTIFARPTLATVHGGQVTHADVKLESGAQVSGVVLNDDRQPVVGTWVYLNPFGAHSADGVETHSDENGQFLLAVPPGEYTVSAENQETNGTDVTLVKAGIVNKVRVNVVSARHMVTATVRVLRADGKPLTDGFVSYSYIARNSRWRSSSIVQLMRPMGAEIRLPKDEAKTLRVEYHNGDLYSEPDVPVTGPEVTLHVHHVNLCSVSGVVTDESGRRLKNSRVALNVQSPLIYQGDIGDVHSGTASSKDGSFRFDGIYPGLRMSLAADAKGYVANVTPVFKVPLSGSKMLPPIRLEKGSFISGLLLHDDGTPIANQRVYVPGHRPDFGFQAYTDAHGRFRIDGIPLSSRVLRVLSGRNEPRFAIVPGANGVFKVPARRPGT